MHAIHPSGSAVKATTAPDRQLALVMVGQALIEYQVQKTPGARCQLEVLAAHAKRLGALSDSDTTLLAQLLARPVINLTLN
ncbi:hypothetical protein KHO49_13645 [Pseudomonas sp. RC4D1]|uniref:hypothetical protein n=1 Tax=Pseudomonas sp. RC4D1 TaxID=2834407 RepID=UPI001BCF539E|nr:hypothetical protein [Pseudomonas sp. RC4D1]MBS7559380.1 hypothetical protein [Pseudomonas sp. RC4D1]